MEFVTPIIIFCTILLLVLIVFVFFAFPSGLEGSTVITFIRSWSTSVTDTVGSVLVRLEEHFWLYIPLGLIGIWRWLTWGFKRVCAEFYRPIDVEPDSPRPSLCIVTPVYNENPQIFRRALDSWEANNPDEVISVIDRSDKNCIEFY